MLGEVGRWVVSSRASLRFFSSCICPIRLLTRRVNLRVSAGESWPWQPALDPDLKQDVSRVILPTRRSTVALQAVLRRGERESLRVVLLCM